MTSSLIPRPTPPRAPALVAERLGKRYGATRALDEFDLVVPSGSVHGLLGPNGAGKTTAVRCFTTLTELDAGTLTIDGIDVRSDPAAVRARIGLVGQFHAVDEALTATQNLVLFARLSGLSKTRAHERAAALLDAFALSDDAGRAVSGFSGGMRRRLDIAASLVTGSELLFLDEPTTGLDPRSRSQVWDIVRAIAAEGTTVLLTTQYLEEADRLADRLAVIDHGRMIAEGTSRELKRSIGGNTLHLRIQAVEQRPEAEALLARVLGVDVHNGSDPLLLTAHAADDALVADALAALSRSGVAVAEFSLGQPSLDEVFFALTGHTADRDSAEAQS